MKQWNRIVNRLQRLARRRQLDRDLEEELRFHLEMLAQDHPDPQRQFGNLTHLKESCRELWTFTWLETCWQDARYALRSMRRNRAFASIAVATLALAIGATTAIFSVLDGIMLRPLPYRDPGRLAMVFTSIPKDHEDEFATSIANFTDWKRQSRTFASLAFYAPESATILDRTGRLYPETVTYADVSDDFFDVLGVGPSVGRAFTPGVRAVVLSHDFWQSRFGGSLHVLEETLELNGLEYSIAGVMPAGFHFPAPKVQAWASAAESSNWWRKYEPRRDRAALVGFGRLKPEFSIQQAQQEMVTIAAGLQQQYRATNDGVTARVVPFQAQILGKTVPFVISVLFGAVLCVLLMACANVANLQLARSAARQPEMALRSALGASRMRLLGQMISENLVLALCGGSAGLILAAWSVRLLVTYGPRNLPRLDEVHIDTRVVVFALAVSVLGGVLLGLAPARKARALVISQFALAVVLLSSAGLLIRSYFAVEAVDPGFQARNVVTMQLRLYSTDEVYDRLMAGVRAIPGVQSAGAINDIFFSQGPKSMRGETLDQVEGHATEARDQWRPILLTPNSGDAFQAMGMRLLKGRQFSEHDGEHDPLVVIINEAMARRFWPGEDAVGKRFKGFPGNNKDWVTVIGVVKNLRNTGLEHEAMSQMFAPPRQFKQGAVLVVRTAEDPERLLASVRRVLRGIDNRAAVGDVSTLAAQLDAQYTERRFQALLLAIFSVLGLVLAAVGIFGLLHYSVSRRTREIGVRMALGARPQEVVRMVLRQGLGLVAVGLGLGLAGALIVARSLASLLFGVRPHDPATFAVVTTLLTLVAVLACYIPARKASRIDPMEALRCG